MLVINFHTLMVIPVQTVKINLKHISLLFDMGTYAYLLEWIQFLIRFTRKL